MDDAQIKVFVEKCDQLKEELDAISKMIFHTKPHPVDKSALVEYRGELQVKRLQKILTLNQRSFVGFWKERQDPH